MALNCNFMRLLTRDEPAVFFCTYLRSTDFLLHLCVLTKQLHIGKLLWRGQETAPPLCEHTLKELEKNWLPYSRKIAIKTAMALEEQDLSQRQLAERMGCSPQYVSRLLKGEENLSLETICKLENALNLSILQTVLD